MIATRKIKFVLSGFAVHLASHFGRSFKNHSYGYACLNDRPNCIASYTANSGSFVQYAGEQARDKQKPRIEL
jgi:hypothetical protein